MHGNIAHAFYVPAMFSLETTNIATAHKNTTVKAGA